MVHPDLLSAVQRVGAELLRRYESRDIHVQSKSEGNGAASYLTDADLFAEAQLFAAIKQHFPTDSIKAEEGTSVKGSTAVWHVDPLDGTSNFIHRIPLWGISVGRATNGVPDIGIIYLPALGQLYVAQQGRGATCNGQSIRVSDKKLKDALYWAAGYGDGKPYYHALVAQQAKITKIVDSSAYELCSIASGNSEIYELQNVPHDVVAGIVIVTEAGGKASDWNGKPYTTASKTVVVTNGACHAEVLKLLKT